MLAICIHCKHMYTGPETSLADETAQDRYVRFVQRLARHIQVKHPDQTQKAVALGSEMVGLVLLSNFQSTDADFLAQRDQIRQRLHVATEPPPVAEIVPDVAGPGPENRSE